MSIIFVQSIGFIGVLCYIVSYQIETNRKLLIWQIAGAVAFIIQFALLQGMSGCFGLIVLVVKDYLLVKRDKWKWVDSRITPAVIILAYSIVVIITWHSYLDILLLISVIGGTIGYWSNNAQKIRLVNLICVAPCWLVYDVAIGSIGGVINELICILSILMSIWRYGWNALGENNFDRSRL